MSNTVVKVLYAFDPSFGTRAYGMNRAQVIEDVTNYLDMVDISSSRFTNITLTVDVVPGVIPAGSDYVQPDNYMLSIEIHGLKSYDVDVNYTIMDSRGESIARLPSLQFDGNPAIGFCTL